MTAVAIISAMNLALIVAVYTEVKILAAVLFVFWVLGLGGALAFRSTRQKAWAYAAFAGFVPFFPIGLVGIYGVRKMIDTPATDQLTGQSTPQKVFGYNQTVVWAYLALGVMSIVVEFVIQFFVSSMPTLAGAAGGMLIIVFFLHKNLKVLQVFPDYFVFQNGALASPQIIRYADIEQLEANKKQVLVRMSDRKKPVKIPFNLFNAAERDEVGQMLEAIRA